MATLEEKQAIERERVERLFDAIDSKAHDLESLIRVLYTAKNFGIDPLPHIKAALRNYIERATALRLMRRPEIIF